MHLNLASQTNRTESNVKQIIYIKMIFKYYYFYVILAIQRMGTVHGEDLPYIFGAPLVEGFSHFPRNYTKSEVALSEAVMIFWSNFARTGNPNEHHRQDQVLLASKERNRFRSINWEEYDPVHQKYLEIGM